MLKYIDLSIDYNNFSKNEGTIVGGIRKLIMNCEVIILSKTKDFKENKGNRHRCIHIIEKSLIKPNKEYIKKIKEFFDNVYTNFEKLNLHEKIKLDIPQRNINAHGRDYYKKFSLKELINTILIMNDVIIFDPDL